MKILVIDHENHGRRLAVQLRNRGVHANVEIMPVSVESPQFRKYQVELELIKQVRDGTIFNFDAIVIGNHDGTGRRFARCIPEALRKQTVITWNDYDWVYAADLRYAKLGIPHFTDKGKACANLLVKIFQPKAELARAA